VIYLMMDRLSARFSRKTERKRRFARPGVGAPV
jgi:hypothetical protein